MTTAVLFDLDGTLLDSAPDLVATLNHLRATLGLAASTVICGDTVALSKPHPEPVLTACKVIGSEPVDTLMVGDDLRDVAVGMRAGCRTTFALYGYADQACHVDVSETTALIRTPAEVLDLLVNPAAM